MTDAPRIVIDGRYLGSHASGIGEYVRALVTRLPRLAPDLTFRLWVRQCAHVPPEVDGTVQIHQVKSHANGPLTLLRPTLLDRLTSRDVFHATYNTLGYGLPCPSIVTVHDVMWVTAPDGCQRRSWNRPIARFYFDRGIRHALRSATKILTVSRASAQDITRVDPAAQGRILVTPNACETCFRPVDDSGELKERVRRILGVTGDYLLLVGQNQPSKGHEIALRAFANARCELTLVLVQRLRVADGLLRLAHELGLLNRLRFLDEVPRADLVSLMQGAVALLQPSSDEGFGLPALEAAACGCPVLASDIPVFREVLDDAAYYVPAGDALAWSRAIVEIATDKSASRELRKRGPLRAACFSWDVAAEQTLQVYREALRRS